MTAVRPLVLAIAVLLAAAPAAAQRPISERRAAAPDGAIRIHNLAGTVRVIGWDRDSIVVQGTIGDGPEPFTVHVSGRNAKLGVWPASGEAPPAELLVHVPRRSQVWIKTESAPVFVDQVTGGLDISSVSGRVEVRGAPRELFAESMAGVLDLTVDTRVLRARTAGADIIVRGRAADAEVLSVSGSVTVENKQVERGRFESVDGSVRYRGGIARGSVVEFITHSGDIDIGLLPGIDADLTVSSFQGSVESLLQGKLVQRGGRGNRQYALTLGRGGADITVRTFKGQVRLGYR